MARSLTVILAALVFGASAIAADGDVYRSKDVHGATVFSDAPSAGAEKIQVSPTTTVPGAPVASLAPASRATSSA